jgi:hypothetical protein
LNDIDALIKNAGLIQPSVINLVDPFKSFYRRTSIFALNLSSRIGFALAIAIASSISFATICFCKLNQFEKRWSNKKSAGSIQAFCINLISPGR